MLIGKEYVYMKDILRSAKVRKNITTLSALSSPVVVPLVSRKEDGKCGYLGKKAEEKSMYWNVVEVPKYIPFYTLNS